MSKNTDHTQRLLSALEQSGTRDMPPAVTLVAAAAAIVEIIKKGGQTPSGESK